MPDDSGQDATAVTADRTKSPARSLKEARAKSWAPHFAPFWRRKRRSRPPTESIIVFQSANHFLGLNCAC